MLVHKTLKVVMIMSSQKQVFLSIDWDYFCKEETSWDLGHLEMPLYLDAAWIARYVLMEYYRTTGEELHFWDWLFSEVKVNKDRLYVTESHSFGALIAPELLGSVYLVDAHHDSWDLNGRDSRYIFCDTWLRQLLERENNKLTEATWVYPSWIGDIETEDGHMNRIRRVEGFPFKIKESGVDCVHICRSGCWTPPWLDSQFIEFVNRGGFSEIVLMENDLGNPMKQRWDASTLELFRNLAVKEVEFLKKNQNILGTIL